MNISDKGCWRWEFLDKRRRGRFQRRRSLDLVKEDIEIVGVRVR